MLKTKFLLPHVMQNVGAGLALLGAAGIVGRFLIHDRTLWEMSGFFGMLLFSIGIMLCAISREKVEDEFMDYLRLRSIYCVVIVYLCATVLRPLVEYIMCHIRVDLSVRGWTTGILGMLQSAPLLVLIYLSIFKVSIWRNSRKEELAA